MSRYVLSYNICLLVTSPFSLQPALAGTDMNMPSFKAYGQGAQTESNPALATNSYWGAALVESVNNGSVPMDRVDDMVTRTLAAYFKMGQDSNYPPTNFNAGTEDTMIGDQVVNEHVKYICFLSL